MIEYLGDFIRWRCGGCRNLNSSMPLTSLQFSPIVECKLCGHVMDLGADPNKKMIYPALCKNDNGHYYIFELYAESEDESKKALGGCSHHFVRLLQDRGLVV